MDKNILSIAASALRNLSVTFVFCTMFSYFHQVIRSHPSHCTLLCSKKQLDYNFLGISSTLAVNWSSELTGFHWLELDFHSRHPGAYQLCSWWQPFVALILSVRGWHSIQNIGTGLKELIYSLVGLDFLQAKGNIMRPWMHTCGPVCVINDIWASSIPGDF